ncbi:polysaccharide biosynthesis protein [Metabacillus sp. GX 13764]|uniref:polysaccharide biosynthesis protein n=1 Tax=Metabacillus kandeliae TaxID=2900151 RepID=UPI001E39FB27|nr:polysaccharide biosynthesis protein [Metabacillus kandeliae]MCD7036126.1 polysaccharide biosynthesis protein [Metabacillus kandeliae]
MDSFIKGTMLLVIAAFAGECLEFFVNMILAKQLGEHGMGMYMSILPFIFFVVVISSLELPISISKFVAEKQKEYHYSMLHHAFKLTVKVTIMVLMLMAAVIPFLPIFNDYHPYVRYLLFLLVPIIAFSSLARGYFMGIQQMDKIAVSQFLRKVFQLAVLFALFRWISFNPETSLFVSMATLVASEAVVFLYLITHYVLQIKTLKQADYTAMTGKEVRKSLLSVSLPTTGLRIFHAAANAIEPFLIKSALIAAGLSGTAATGQYGLLAGVAMSIGFFPAFISHSLMVALLPNVSDSASKGDSARLRRLLQQSMRATCLYGIPAVTIMYIFADPLTHLFFHSVKAPIFLQLLWPYFLFHFFIHPLQAYLIGLGLVKDAFYHSVWSNIVSFLIMYWLGSMGSFQMNGIIIGMNVGILLQTMLHYLTICRKIGLTVFLGESGRKAY